ncbi:MAG: amidohydrolase family protein [Pseudomonadota bacterium]
MTGLIDVHAHFCPGDFPADPKAGGTKGWPCMDCASGANRSVMVDGDLFRALDDRSWDAQRRIADMDRDGVAIQVLSPMPELLAYWVEDPAYDLLAAHVNGAIASIVAKHPKRFRGLGMVAMQDPARAVKMLPDIKTKYGLSGIEIGSNINGLALGDPRFDEVFAACEDLGLSVFVHALHPAATPHIDPSPTFGALVGFPIDTAVTIAHLLMSGVTQKFPNLRIGFSHAGGAILSILHRLDKGWHVTKGYGGKLDLPPSQAARGLFYDSLVYDPGYLSQFLEGVGEGQTFLGTDYPYLIMQDDPASFLAATSISDNSRDSVRFGAARRFLDLETT